MLMPDSLCKQLPVLILKCDIHIVLVVFFIILFLEDSISVLLLYAGEKATGITGVLIWLRIRLLRSF
jgi:hypothetical protein